MKSFIPLNQIGKGERKNIPFESLCVCVCVCFVLFVRLVSFLIFSKIMFNQEEEEMTYDFLFFCEVPRAKFLPTECTSCLYNTMYFHTSLYNFL